MADRLTVTLHELVAELDIYADAYLQRVHGVSFNLFELLNVLVERAPIDISGLARCLRVTKAAVSKRLPALEADGWVKTTPGQGRQIMIAPTEKTLSLVQHAGGELEAHFAEMLADPRLAPGADAVESELLNRHLTALTQIVIEKGTPA
ncbi:MarR family winged helix-turn-helix transcriptional regulator [Microbacterium telephonicum]|uniref:DNA-binding MarR family transcriptional regulator n=1 Tax=Microbacterium telephonicum TaxID=1714841 RepID=A0A498C413_9MICO|nr:MarR family transcriptional regulator [Microbacterium telephonicum]RLK47830.1 DNA-binding MarR family transcriptional regulator [Microbacterium telephonicum]